MTKLSVNLDVVDEDFATTDAAIADLLGEEAELVNATVVGTANGWPVINFVGPFRAVLGVLRRYDPSMQDHELLAAFA